MTEEKQYKYYNTTDAIHAMCCEHDLFVYGTLNDYHRMFDLARKVYPELLHDVALIIWFQSEPDKHTFEEVYDLLLKYWSQAQEQG